MLSVFYTRYDVILIGTLVPVVMPKSQTSFEMAHLAQPCPDQPSLEQLDNLRSLQYFLGLHALVQHLLGAI